MATAALTAIGLPGRRGDRGPAGPARPAGPRSGGDDPRRRQPARRGLPRHQHLGHQRQQRHRVELAPLSTRCANSKPMAGRARQDRGMNATSRRRPAASIEELVAGASRREPLEHGDGKSGSTLERLEIDGQPYVLKVIHPDQDWIARACGDLCCWPVYVWTSGLLDLVPPVIDHSVVGAATGLGRNGWGGALLMRDVGPWLLPEGDAKVPGDVHLGFLDHMAALHARFWAFEDTFGLLLLSGRYLFFSDAMVEVERERGFPAAVPPIAAEGWERLARVAHPAVAPLLELRRDPSPLVAAL